MRHVVFFGAKIFETGRPWRALFIFKVNGFYNCKSFYFGILFIKSKEHAYREMIKTANLLEEKKIILLIVDDDLAFCCGTSHLLVNNEGFC